MVSMQRISIFIPVYRESALLDASLKSLIEDPYRRKEIFVVIDEPTARSLELTEKYGNKVRFILNGKRKGKVNALNEAINLSKGDLFLFLDDDVKVSRNPGAFLASISDELDKADLIQVKERTIRESFLAKMVGYDDVGFNFVYFMFSKLLGRCPGVSGPAFAIRRDVFEEVGGFRRVIQDDFDIGIRAFLGNKRFKFVENMEVSAEAPASWKEWFKQRRRWGFGAALCIKDYFKQLLRMVVRYPQVLVPSLFFIFPSLTLLLSQFFISNALVEKLLMVFLTFMPMKLSILMLPISLTLMGIVFVKNMLLSFVSFGFFSVLFYLMAKRLDYKFSPVEFAFYFFVYSPMWLFIVIVSLIKVFLFSTKMELEDSLEL